MLCVFPLSLPSSSPADNSVHDQLIICLYKIVFFYVLVLVIELSGTYKQCMILQGEKGLLEL
jgi:hypothetical protein